MASFLPIPRRQALNLAHHQNILETTQRQGTLSITTGAAPLSMQRNIMLQVSNSALQSSITIHLWLSGRSYALISNPVNFCLNRLSFLLPHGSQNLQRQSSTLTTLRTLSSTTTGASLQTRPVISFNISAFRETRNSSRKDTLALESFVSASLASFATACKSTICVTLPNSTSSFGTSQPSPQQTSLPS